MSRTYRFKKEKWLIESNYVMRDWLSAKEFENCNGCDIANWNKWGLRLYEVSFFPDGAEGKKRLAKYHSDAKWHYFNHRGPGWFHNLYSQRPYRRNAKNQIHKYMKDDEYEIQLLNKPKREYWT